MAKNNYTKNYAGLIVTHKAGSSDLFKATSSKKIEGLDFQVSHTFGADLPSGLFKAGASQGTVLMEADQAHLDTFNPWDLAHAAKNADPAISFVEPDLIMKAQAPGAKKSSPETLFKGTGSNRCTPSTAYDNFWPKPDKPMVWHLGDDFSQLGSARASFIPENDVVIVHLDTGYTEGHSLLPLNILKQYEVNFADDEGQINSAVDICNDGFGNQVAHGTGTICILAGNKLILNGKEIILGGAPEAKILPIRISPTVVLLKTSALVRALDYILKLADSDKGLVADVISMSMGGLASKEWARAVNQIYDKGIFMVTAAGNNMGGKTPTHLVYPARFNRVVAACGVTYNQDQYYRNILGFEMMGNFGPDRLMHTAMAAYTPNIPWAKGCCDVKDIFDMDGAGTSSATPQIAAAAALYINHYKKELKYFTGWRKVEAVRYALFTAANDINNTGADSFKYFGQGILKAKDALDIAPDLTKLAMSPVDKVSFPLFQVLFMAKAASDESKMEMYQLEILQLMSNNYELQLIMGNQESFLDLDTASKKNFIDALIGSPNASIVLKAFLKDNYAMLTRATTN
ncbi:S8 family peptidase [Mucilaginibacter psychrotolerans]|uniref:Peptidase S8/S53 domain-containing protein n=1 Tax=Mucilaginibacter psychrotolerans TaxID=1524096 RepID=A0A4Y8SCD8_9SPHI|nr:S8/S53 family peptidase [Mucilaginibacter psychrotolerans]TFF36321.1 hypothetical protein E2R66_15915 [Mucilaginibacter psychrotolerans]